MVYQCLNDYMPGIIISLKKLLGDKDITVRQKSTECLYVIAGKVAQTWFYCVCIVVLWWFLGHAIGREAFLREEIILPLSKLFDDSEDIARRNAHMAFEMLSESPKGVYGCELISMLEELITQSFSAVFFQVQKEL